VSASNPGLSNAPKKRKPYNATTLIKLIPWPQWYTEETNDDLGYNLPPITRRNSRTGLECRGLSFFRVRSFGHPGSRVFTDNQKFSSREKPSPDLAAYAAFDEELNTATTIADGCSHAPSTTMPCLPRSSPMVCTAIILR
jgi:hypothetical protein